MTTADTQPKDGNEPGSASGTQEVIETFGALSEAQFRHIGQLLGEPLGRFKAGSTHFVFGQMTAGTAGAVCAYLRDQAVTHGRETTTRWSPLTGSADQPPAAAAQPAWVEGRAMDDCQQCGNALPGALTAAAGTGAGPDVHVLVYSHRHGDDNTVHYSIAQARAALAGIAREWWHEITGYDGVPPSPDGLTDDQAIETYFGHEETERYQIAAARLPQPAAPGGNDPRPAHRRRCVMPAENLLESVRQAVEAVECADGWPFAAVMQAGRDVAARFGVLDTHLSHGGELPGSWGRAGAVRAGELAAGHA